MKAAILKEWNKVELEEIEIPQPGKDEALLKVLYGGVCGSDITVYRGLHPTAVAPVVLCHEILGQVVSLPANYTGSIQVGDRVLVNPVTSCGNCAACRAGHENVCANLKLLGIHINGGFAEYTKAYTSRLVPVSPELPDQIAVLGEPFAVAYHVNRRANTSPGDKVLIIGAGTIGIVVGLVAQMRGADVILSELNEKRLALAASVGLRTISPQQKDLHQQLQEDTGADGYDIVIDASGSKAGTMMLPDLAKCAGYILSLGLSGAPYEFPIGKVSFKELKLIGSRLYSQEDFEAGVQALHTLHQTKGLSKIVSDILPLSEVTEAIEQMKAGKNTGKIIIRC